MAQFDLSNFNRFILSTEDDANSPLAEELMTQLRENLVGLLLLMLDTGDGGVVDSNPPDDNTGVLTDADPTNGAYTADEHNGRTLLMTSGTAKGNIYTIDDTTTTTLICTGDNLYSDGVRTADTYKILYDLKVNTDGHDHDGINSAQVAGTSVTGTYTGDGARSKAITGVGFTPKFVKIWEHVVAGAGDADRSYVETMDQWGATMGMFHDPDEYKERELAFVSLDADGFTVDDQTSDDHPNKNAQVYDYLCL